MAVIKSYETLLKIRDMYNKALNQLIKESPYFINLFSQVGVASQVKHEWMEDQICPLETAYTSATNVGVFTVASATGWSAGDYVRMKGDSAVLKITAINGAGTEITTSFIAANGSDYTASTIPTAAGILVFDHHPTPEGSRSGKEVFHQGGTEYNCTEILRKDVSLSATMQAVATYGGENNISVQEKEAMRQITSELNKIALFGVRSERTSLNPEGSCGGLYYFGNQSGSLGVDAQSKAVSAELINDAAQAILEEGGNPTTIMCSQQMRRAISSLPADRLVMGTDPNIRGSFVKGVICDATGDILNVVAEPALRATNDIWVFDPSGFGRVPLKGREIFPKPIRDDELDGTRTTIIGEMTLQFKNAKQKLCRIKGLQSPSITIPNNYAAPVRVNVVNPSTPNKLDTPVLTATKKDADEITLSWANNAHAVMYQYKQATSEAGLATATPTTIAHNADGTAVGSLTADTTYYYQLRAVGDGDSYTTSDWSTAKSAKTDAE